MKDHQVQAATKLHLPKWMGLFIYGTVEWFEKEEDCQIHIKCDIIFPVVPLALSPWQNCLQRLQGMSCWAAASPCSSLDASSLSQQYSWSPAYTADPTTHNLPSFSLWLTRVKSLWMFSAIGSPFPPGYPLTLPALHICKDVTRLRKSLKHKLLSLVYTYPFPMPFLRHQLLAKT